MGVTPKARTISICLALPLIQNWAVIRRKVRTSFSAWMNTGMSAPVVMDSSMIDLIDTVAADVNLDTVVDVSDLLQVLADWGPCGGCTTDLNGNGDVGTDDLLIVIAAWGPC